MAAVGQMLADRARSRILLALADGRALPASMLAAEAGVQASTASGHLRKLTERGLIEVLATGRYRYYRLASPDVAPAGRGDRTAGPGGAGALAARRYPGARAAPSPALLRPHRWAARRRGDRRAAFARPDRGPRRHC
jgi:DNA-binding transcriptional ArsR family regulator